MQGDAGRFLIVAIVVSGVLGSPAHAAESVGTFVTGKDSVLYPDFDELQVESGTLMDPPHGKRLPAGQSLKVIDFRQIDDDVAAVLMVLVVAGGKQGWIEATTGTLDLKSASTSNAVPAPANPSPAAQLPSVPTGKDVKQSEPKPDQVVTPTNGTDVQRIAPRDADTRREPPAGGICAGPAFDFFQSIMSPQKPAAGQTEVAPPAGSYAAPAVPPQGPVVDTECPDGTAVQQEWLGTTSIRRWCATATGASFGPESISTPKGDRVFLRGYFDAAGKRDGPYVSYDVNKSTGEKLYLLERGRFSHGLLEGEWEIEDGGEICKGQMSASKKVGRWRCRSGESAIESTYREYEGGALARSGNLDVPTDGPYEGNLHDGSDIKARGVFKAGKKVGQWERLYESGETWWVETYVAPDVLHGTIKVFCKDGTLIGTAQVGPGTLGKLGQQWRSLRNGEEVWFFHDGSVRLRRTWKLSHLDGPVVIFWPNGKKRVEGLARADRVASEWRYWKESGVLEKIVPRDGAFLVDEFGNALGDNDGVDQCAGR